MTQHQLDRAVARSTGESLRTIRRLGFGTLSLAADLEPEDLRLALDCPFCGHSIAWEACPDTWPDLAQCDHCDVEFDYEPAEIHVIANPAPEVAA